MERRKARRGRRRVTREEFWEEQKRDMDPAYGETKREAWRKKERDKPFRDMGTTAALFSDLAAMRPGRSSVGCPGGYPGACPKREGGTVHGQALYPADRPAGDAWYLPRGGPGPPGGEPAPTVPLRDGRPRPDSDISIHRYIPAVRFQLLRTGTGKMNEKECQ